MCRHDVGHIRKLECDNELFRNDKNPKITDLLIYVIHTLALCANYFLQLITFYKILYESSLSRLLKFMFRSVYDIVLANFITVATRWMRLI